MISCYFGVGGNSFYFLRKEDSEGHEAPSLVGIPLFGGFTAMLKRRWKKAGRWDAGRRGLAARKLLLEPTVVLISKSENTWPRGTRSWNTQSFHLPSFCAANTGRRLSSSSSGE
jgi:hypothetical protein